ncbi:hypothetical protein BJX68DRAFT_238075 [Aspergillus pseudodeflectus]|uniref:Uncharacterized protein n=1 Tax=Aspergillus pseudodeflectus TaxID=176178 RepID=A0ABR4KA00_9EURO
MRYQNCPKYKSNRLTTLDRHQRHILDSHKRKIPESPPPPSRICISRSHSQIYNHYGGNNNLIQQLVTTGAARFQQGQLRSLSLNALPVRYVGYTTPVSSTHLRYSTFHIADRFQISFLPSNDDTNPIELRGASSPARTRSFPLMLISMSLLARRIEAVEGAPGGVPDSGFAARWKTMFGPDLFRSTVYSSGLAFPPSFTRICRSVESETEISRVRG